MKKIKNKKIFIITLFLTFISFNISLALWTDLLTAGGEIKALIDSTQRLLTSLIAVSFLYIVYLFIYKSDDNGKKNLSYGIIALTVFITIWGIVSFMKQSTFGNDTMVDLHNGPKTEIKGY